MTTILYRDGTAEQKSGEPIVINNVTKLKHDFVVRLITDNGFQKRCIAEEVFDEHPSSAQIAWCLLKYPDATFAAVTDRYSIDREMQLPFE